MPGSIIAAIVLLAAAAAAGSAQAAAPPLPPTPARNASDPYYTAFHFQPLKNWMNGAPAAPSPLFAAIDG
jgi:hypothetical protein